MSDVDPRRALRRRDVYASDAAGVAATDDGLVAALLEDMHAKGEPAPFLDVRPGRGEVLNNDSGYPWSARGAITCPHYSQIGKKVCLSGCWEEPECQTNEPSEGWVMPASEHRRAVVDLVQQYGSR